MPAQPDYPIFGCFINGYSMHSRFDLGDLAVKKILELYPDDAGRDILMSNLNASRGIWDEASQFRDLMKRKDLWKHHIHQVLPVNPDLKANAPSFDLRTGIDLNHTIAMDLFHS